jgi:sodium pump decarboxylase gamma subunit
MKRFLSRLSVALIMLSLFLGIGSIAVSAETAYDEDTLKEITEYYFQSWCEVDFQQYIDLGYVTDEEDIALYTRWQELKDTIGDYEEITDTTVEESDTTLVTTVVAKFSNSTIHFTLTFDKEIAAEEPYSAITEIDAFLPTSTSSQPNMLRAGMNTLMGMGVVFLVLIFISVIIWLLKFVPALFEKPKEKSAIPASVPASRPAATVNTAVTDDTELLAVITAAIMALRAEESVSGDSDFVVRSIRRRHS